MMLPHQARSGADFLWLCEQRRRQLRGKVQTPTAMSGSGLPRLPEGWVWSSLSSVCERVSVGHVGPTTEYFSNAGDSVALIRSQDVRPGRLEAENCARITPKFHASLKKSQLKGGDILVVRVGANRGDSCVVPPGLGELNCANIIFARPLHSGGFFGFFTRSEFGQHLLLSATTGAAQGVINTQSVAALPVPVPPWPVQERIASILAAYDDLIENNTRRIAILEEMARRIYQEWFVRFRFPGHEGVRMVESELGLVPGGWRAAALGDVAAYINRGLAPKYDAAAACMVINQKCIRDQRLNLGEARKQGKPVPAEKVVRLGDVLINSTGVGTLGRVAQVLEAIDNCTVDTHVSIVRPGKDCDPDFFGLTLLAQQAHFEAQGVGSTGQTELSRGRIAETSVVVPPLAVQRAFGKLVQPMRRLTVTLQNKNLNLRTTRDLLLPKLISGELDVSAMPEPEALAA
jgi:type I restriction enzyme, S subunit